MTFREALFKLVLWVIIGFVISFLAVRFSSRKK